MKKTREQNELENREKVQIFFRLIVNSWTISRLRKEVVPKLIKKEFRPLSKGQGAFPRSKEDVRLSCE